MSLPNPLDNLLQEDMSNLETRLHVYTTVLRMIGKIRAGPLDQQDRLESQD